MTAGRHRRGRGILHQTEPPRHTARGLHVARTAQPPSLQWERSDWFAGLSWSDELPWPTAATIGGVGPRGIEAPVPLAEGETGSPRR
jgi:hypothetical protein